MKIGIVSSAANYLPTWDERFAHLKALGYEAVDHGLFDIKQVWYTDDTKLSAHCAEVRAAAEKHGLEISQVHGPWPTDDTTSCRYVKQRSDCYTKPANVFCQHTIVLRNEI